MKEKFLAIVGVLITLIIFMFAYAGILMWLWNLIIVVLFNAPIISFWQAFGLCIIANILFKEIRIGDKIND